MERPIRKRIRLAGYDYAAPGAYFITVCTKDKRGTLAEIREGAVLLLPPGRIVDAEIGRIPEHFPVSLDKYVVMPNHIHLIIAMRQEEQRPVPTVSAIVGALKSITTSIANKRDGVSGRQLWQRSFYDRIIRNEQEYQNIWEYIDTNPLRWSEDCYYCQS